MYVIIFTFTKWALDFTGNRIGASKNEIKRACIACQISKLAIIPTQNTKPSFGLRPKDGFVSKWVYNFLPSQKLVHLSGYFKHHIGGGQLPKNMYEIL